MDRRTLIFVCLFAISIFFIQNWFSSRNKGQQTEWNQQQQEKIKQEEVQKQEEFKQRTISFMEVPLAELFFDSNGTDFFSKGLLFNNGFLLEASEKEMPNELYVKLSGETQPSRKVHLDTSKYPIKWLALYSSSEVPSIQSIYLPEATITDLQFISLGDKETPPSITLGEYKNAYAYFPENAPDGNAIALIKYKGRLMPVGYYISKEKQFINLAEVPSVKPYVQFEKLPSVDTPKQEEFYVLENAFQQVVFSNIGGAISEINLPFESKENTFSIVKPISFDRIIEKKYTNNAHFPNFPAWIVKSDSEPVRMQPETGGYYPFLRRDLFGPEGKIVSDEPPRFYATTIFSEDKQTQRSPYKIKRFEKDLIEFELVTPSRRIIKTYSFPKEKENAPYCLDLSVRVDGDTRSLWLTSGVPEVELVSGNFMPSIKYRMTRNLKPVVEKMSMPSAKNFTTTIGSIHPDWISNSNGFFGIIIDPLSTMAPGFKADYIQGHVDPTRLTLIDRENKLYPPEKYPGYQYLIPFPFSNQVQNFRVFAGPLATDILKMVDQTYSDSSTGYNPDYLASRTFVGWFSFVSEPFAKFLLFLIKTFYGITHSWGFSIILLTLALRIMLYPLNAWSIKSTLRMQQVQPLVKAIQDKHKKDQKKAQLETMQLYREYKANPFMGCLPLLIQMPFLMGMFDLLKSTFELRGASFIPGWIDNLTAPDVLFSWHFSVPFFGTNFHLLPILLGFIMFFQQKFSSMQKSKSELTDQQKQQQKMGSITTIIFTVMFYHFPSGLNIYWISSMSLSILQQWIMSKRFKPIDTKVQVLKRK